MVPAVINRNSLLLGLGYVFDSTSVSHGQYLKKIRSGKDINRVKNMNNKTSLTFENTYKNAHMEKKMARYMFLENFNYFLLFAFFQSLYF